MTLDPMLALSFSLHSNKGAYALLLGSGISRAAEIPTGWEVMLELIRKLAVVKGVTAEPDPAQWYRDEFGREPDYSDLLELVAQTPTERNQLLRSYFEPTTAERAEGLKMPTAAHESIARLVARGHIRVIITTNFDRLLEQALEEQGVRPSIVSTPDQVEGVEPLVHTSCLIVKVHGDYLDSRIKNTVTELASYDDRIDKLLDRIMDEFGLIICGWSGDWDEALRNVLLRCPSRRYMTYWTSRRPVTGDAKRVFDARGSRQVLIDGADQLFVALEDKMAALEDFNRPHPLSTVANVASMKRFLEEPKYRIRLHDLMRDECERVVRILDAEFTLQKLVASTTLEPALFTRALIERSEGTGCWHCLSGFASSARVAVE
jgi:hypothetical protein